MHRPSSSRQVKPTIIDLSDDVSDGIGSKSSSKRALEQDNVELERIMKHWRSPVYAFYERVPRISYVGGRRCHEFFCAARKCNYKSRRFLDNSNKASTGNLILHVKSCWGKEAWNAAKQCHNARDAREKVTKPLMGLGSTPGKRMRGNSGKGRVRVSHSHSMFTKAETRAEVVRWVAESLRPFEIVEDPRLQNLMKRGCFNHYMPPASTVSTDVKLIFARTRDHISRMLQEYDGHINFTVDAWTLSPNRYAYVAVTAHFEAKGQPVAIVLDIVEVPKSRSTGLNLALALAGVLRSFGIEHKIFSVTCKNAPDNDTMLIEAGHLLPMFFPINRTRCFNHILNLVAMSFLKQFDIHRSDSLRTDDEERSLLEFAGNIDEEERTMAQENDEDEDIKEDDSLEGWVDEVEALPDKNRQKLDESIRPAKRMLVKLRKLAFKIVHSTILLPTWKICLERLKLTLKIIPRDVSTRWSSTFNMLDFAMEYRKAIERITSDRTNDLQQFELSEEEWVIAKELRFTLKMLKDATLYCSRGTPNLATVIPVMDHIDTIFTDACLPTSPNHPAVRAAIGIAKKALNRYYSPADAPELYRIAMALHPRHKLVYFKNAGRTQDWIVATEILVRGQFESRYKTAEAGKDREDSGDQESEDVTEIKTPITENIFDNLPSLGPLRRSTAVIDELQLFLSRKPEHVTDAVQWWYENRKTYPRLYRMALDYLTVPANTIDVERLFSHGHSILLLTRSQLSVTSTRALLCLGSWSHSGLVQGEDVKAVVKLDEIDAQAELNMLGNKLRPLVV